MKRVRIVGAGFSGLTLAYELNKRRVPVELYEREQVGGLLRTVQGNSGLAEAAANGFLQCKEMEALCRELNLKVLLPKKAAKRRYISFQGELRQWPLSFMETLSAGLKVMRIFFLHLRPKPFETVQQMSVRMFGHAPFQKVIAPALQGIYGSQISKLSATLVFGPMWKQFLPTVSQPTRARQKGLVGLHGGMGTLISRIRDHLSQNGVAIHQQNVMDLKEIQGPDTHLVVATPLHEAARLFALPVQEMQDLISVTIWFPEERKIPKGFGGLFPKEEQSIALGVLFNSDTFVDRAHSGLRSETWILDFKAVGLRNDEELISEICKDRSKRWQSIARPVEYKVFRWNKALPVYGLELEKFLRDHGEYWDLQLHGNFMGGIGLSKIYCRSIEMADKLKERLA